MKTGLHTDLLELAARHLGDLIADVAFLGGCSVVLLITDQAAPDIRPTEDVDIIVEVASRMDY